MFYYLGYDLYSKSISQISIPGFVSFVYIFKFIFVIFVILLSDLSIYESHRSSLCGLNTLGIQIQCLCILHIFIEALHDKSIHIHLVILTDPVCSRNRLVLNRWVPVRAHEVNLAELLEVESLTSGLNLKD